MECSGQHPEWHIMQDVIPLVNGDCAFETCDGAKHTIAGEWDILIAFPPCTHLAVSGAAHFKKKRENGQQQQGVDFFMRLATAKCARIAIENPIGIMSKKYQKPDQIIQPWQFGDNVGKSTCIWLKGLPLLKQQISVRPPAEYHVWQTKKGQTKRQEMWFYKTRCLPYKERGIAASKTFPGIAKAMAEQWTEQILRERGVGK